jgi:hypothetical protein
VTGPRRPHALLQDLLGERAKSLELALAAGAATSDISPSAGPHFPPKCSVAKCPWKTLMEGAIDAGHPSRRACVARTLTNSAEVQASEAGEPRVVGDAAVAAREVRAADPSCGNAVNRERHDLRAPASFRRVSAIVGKVQPIGGGGRT